MRGRQRFRDSLGRWCFDSGKAPLSRSIAAYERRWAVFLYDLILFVLVDQLDHRRFRTREAAQKTLEKFGEAAIPALQRGEQDASAERSTRCRWLLALHAHTLDKRAWEQSGTIFPPHWPRLPWLFLEESYESQAVLTFLHPVQARDGYGAWATGYKDWRAATRGWVATQLRHGYSEGSILTLMDRMAWAEIAWTWRHAKLGRLFPTWADLPE